jgi:hypothetical protein
MFKKALIAVVLALGAVPAMASDNEAGHLLASAIVPASSISNVSHAMADVRVRDCEQQQARAAEQQRVSVERERKAEFLRHVWTAP